MQDLPRPAIEVIGRTALAFLLAAVALFQTPLTGSAAPWREHLVFYASFDSQLDAEIAGGDPVLYFQENGMARPGLPEGVVLEKNQGRFGNSLRFVKKQKPVSFFKARENMPYRSDAWSGTVSFWLKVDPETELEPGYTDPIQITSKDWNNAAFFVEFGKDEKPRHFRLGVYADFSVWNPRNRDWNDIPFAEKPLVSVERPPFTRERWTHVAFTFENFNTGKPDGTAALYLDGALQGRLSPRTQTFTWDLDKAKIMLGLSFIGGLDELGIFDRSLTGREIAELFQLKESLRAKPPAR